MTRSEVRDCVVDAISKVMWINKNDLIEEYYILLDELGINDVDLDYIFEIIEEYFEVDLSVSLKNDIILNLEDVSIGDLVDIIKEELGFDE